MGKVDYYVFAFLFRVLVACRPRFCLAILASGAFKSQAIGEAVSAGGEVAVGLLGLPLWKVWISFHRCCIADAGSQVFFSLG